MLRNYLNIAIRTLHRNLVYSFINITGLSIGIACSVLILLWVYDEVTYDQSFSKYEELYQVKVNNSVDQGVVTRSTLPMALKDVLLQQDSRIKHFAITVSQPALLTVGEKKLDKIGIDASESFLTIFDYKMIAGNAETALKVPRSIVLTQSSARALFGTEDVLGKFVQVKIEKNEELKVTGVIADPPNNVSLRPEFILPFAYFEATSPWVKYARGNWSNNAFEYYVELQPGTEKEVVDTSIKDIIKKNNPDVTNRELFLHAMSHWRLHNNFVNGREDGGLIIYVRLFTGIAIFILVIACINFMNLSTARSEHRAREVGIRKTVGSGRNEL
ncbi:MAG TPA: ABC transporter permease, partial [Cyclobacteriaceae bacterium]